MRGWIRGLMALLQISAFVAALLLAAPHGEASTDRMSAEAAHPRRLARQWRETSQVLLEDAAARAQAEFNALNKDVQARARARIAGETYIVAPEPTTPIVASVR